MIHFVFVYFLFFFTSLINREGHGACRNEILRRLKTIIKEPRCSHVGADGNRVHRGRDVGQLLSHEKSSETRMPAAAR